MTVDARELKTYADLLAAFQPRPIRNEREASDVSSLIDSLTDLPKLSEGQREFVGLLGQLLYGWETEHEEPIEVSPQEIVHSLLEDNGLRQVDLVGPVFPSASAVSDFLAGRRPLSYERVGNLATFFHVSPAVFYPARGDPPAFYSEDQYSWARGGRAGRQHPSARARGTRRPLPD